MHSPATQVIILAGGRGTRFRQATPKVLLPVAGQPMIVRAVAAAEQARFGRPPIVVVGYRGDLVRRAVGTEVRFADQRRQRGTGHAVAAALPLVRSSIKRVVVTYGDHPLVTGAMLRQVAAALHPPRVALALITVPLPDFRGSRRVFQSYGRIVRDSRSRYVARCVEVRDATRAERAIREVNSGQYAFDAAWLRQALPRLQTKNEQGEYYLTDLIALAVADGKRVRAVPIDAWWRGLGANTPADLAVATRFATSPAI